MTRTIAYCALIVFFGLVGATSLTMPSILDDSNSFMKNLVDHTLIEILAVIVSITLASISVLHLEFNKIEENLGAPFLVKARAGVRQAASWLIVLLAMAIVVVFVKPLLPLSDKGQAFVNGIAMFILFWNLLLLVSITQAVFAIKPNFGNR